jgi:hypothetical protein
MKQLAYCLLLAIALSVFAMLGIGHNLAVAPRPTPAPAPPERSAVANSPQEPLETLGHIGSYRMHANGAKQADDGL